MHQIETCIKRNMYQNESEANCTCTKIFSLQLGILLDYIQQHLYYSDTESQYICNLFEPKTYIDMNLIIEEEKILRSSMDKYTYRNVDVFYKQTVGEPHYYTQVEEVVVGTSTLPLEI